MLPPTCRWIRDAAGAHLHCHFVCIAACYPDGRFWLARWGRAGQLEARAATQRQAMRYVERMIEVRGIPWAPRSRHGRRGTGALLPASPPPARVILLPFGAAERAALEAELEQLHGPLPER